MTSKSFTLGSMWTQYGKQGKSSILRAPNPSSSILTHSMKNKYDQNIKNILKYGALTSLKDDGALTSLILRAPNPSISILPKYRTHIAHGPK